MDAMMDTVETQAERVRGVMDAGHTRRDRREMGYTYATCAACGCGWPCPDMAQAIEWRG